MFSYTWLYKIEWCKTYKASAALSLQLLVSPFWMTNTDCHFLVVWRDVSSRSGAEHTSKLAIGCSVCGGFKCRFLRCPFGVARLFQPSIYLSQANCNRSGQRTTWSSKGAPWVYLVGIPNSCESQSRSENIFFRQRKPSAPIFAVLSMK